MLLDLNLSQMKTYAYAQSLLSSQLKGYKFVVSSCQCQHVGDWVVANMTFAPFTAPTISSSKNKELVLARISLFRPRESLKSVRLLLTVDKERKELLLEFRLMQEDDMENRAPADNGEYVFFQDLLKRITEKFNGVQCEEGKADFFELVQKLNWGAQTAELKTYQASLKGTNWASIGIGSALLFGGILQFLLKKKD